MYRTSRRIQLKLYVLHHDKSGFFKEIDPLLRAAVFYTALHFTKSVAVFEAGKRSSLPGEDLY